MDVPAVAGCKFAIAAGVALLLPVAVGAADYITAAECKNCHPSEYATQSRSAHALALSPTIKHRLLGELPVSKAWNRTPDFSCSFEVTPKGLRAQIDGQNQHQEAGLEWAFGAGSQGITFVGKRPGEAYLEFSLSFYTRSKVFGVTPGHERIQPVSAVQALGIPFAIYSGGGEMLECFRCHSTGEVSVAPDDSIEPGELGVRCEDCHGPGSEHRDAAMRGAGAKIRSSIESPGRLSAAELNRFCGGCHRFMAPNRTQIDLTFAWNVRHQPPYLERSACFRKSAGRLSCLTCHSPHESARRNDPAFYNRKCTGCHTSSSQDAPSCKVSQGDCIDCHMPRVRPSEYMQFRSHWIGIYSPQADSPSLRFTPPRS